MTLSSLIQCLRWALCIATSEMTNCMTSQLFIAASTTDPASDSLGIQSFTVLRQCTQFIMRRSSEILDWFAQTMMMAGFSSCNQDRSLVQAQTCLPAAA